MELKTENKEISTKANLTGENRVSISKNEAIEYREYKRQKKRAEISSAIANSEGILADFEDEKKVREYAMRLRQAAVCMTTERLEIVSKIFTQHKVAVDCLVGGNGETLASVKAYEAKKAARLKAREITVTISPYSVLNCRYEELRKELKKVRRAVPKLTFKVRVDRVYSPSILARLALLCSEIGAAYFCIPYFDGCERVRLDLRGGCKLQVSGVDLLDNFKKLRLAGVERILTTRAWEMFSEWMKEVEKINFPELMSSAQKLSIGQIETEKREIKPLRLPPCEPQKMLTAGAEKAEC